MENKESKKKEILDLFKKDVITTDKALEMLNKLNTPSIVKWAKEQEKKKEPTFDDIINRIAEETVADMDVDHVLVIMQDMGWKYMLNEHVVTRQEVIDCMLDNVRSALRYLVENQIKENLAYATTKTGGFQCRAWVDDDDWDNIQVELAFQPYTAYGEGHLEELINLKKQEK